MAQPKVLEGFTLTKTETENGMFLTVSPLDTCEGFKPKTIQITPDFWDGLRYHFATKVFDGTPNKKVILSYIK